MSSIRTFGSAVLALASALVSAEAAAAGHHHICFQDQGTATGLLTAVFACRADDPMVSCTVSVGSQGIFSQYSGTNWETSRLTYSLTTASYNAQFQFSDGVTRNCGVSLKTSGTTTTAGPPSAGATLVGFTTDASGLVTTGVWTARSRANATRVGQTLMVPYGFLAVGGGGTGAEVPYGALLYQSHRSGSIGSREWQIGTQDDLYAQPHDNDVYAIGLRIEGLSASLLSLLDAQSAGSGSSPLLANPTAGVVRPAGFVPLGGSFDANAPPAFPLPPALPQYFGQYATASYPMLLPNFCHPACEEPFSAVGWMAESKDHLVSRPGWVNTELLSLPDHLTVNGVSYVVLGSVVSATSGVAGHPSVVVPGKRGEYALTGVGAFVDWKTNPAGGNLLWKLIPRPDIGGVEAASKDHGVVSPAAITGYALGIKLVDPSTLPPPPVVEPPPGSLILHP